MCSFAARPAIDHELAVGLLEGRRLMQLLGVLCQSSAHSLSPGKEQEEVVMGHSAKH